jgi:hypothetical protein
VGGRNEERVEVDLQLLYAATSTALDSLRNISLIREIATDCFMVRGWTGGEEAMAADGGRTVAGVASNGSTQANMG